MQSPSKNLKIVLFGQINVGKTNLINRFVEDTFTEGHIIGANIKNKEVVLSTGETVNVQIWDSCCNEKQQVLNPIKIYFKDTDGVILVYDVNDKSTLNDLNTLFENIKGKLSNKIPIILIGNKKDTNKGNYQVTIEEGQAFANKNGCFRFFEVSAKENINVNNSFLCLIEKAYQNKFN